MILALLATPTTALANHSIREQSAAPFFGIDTGISVQDAHNFWETVNPLKNQVTGATPDFPMVFVSHDGTKTWQQQKLPLIPGLANTHYTTAPPVFSGNYGLMPVKVTPNSACLPRLASIA